MGRASRTKRERRTRPRTAHVEVVCPGMLQVLSVGKGDIKLTIGGPGEVDDARKIIEEMLRKGYGIFVETDAGLRRVKKFNPKRMTYVISEIVEETLAELTVHAGRWARVARYAATDSAGSMASKLRHGDLLMPPGRWQFEGRRNDEAGSDLYALYEPPAEAFNDNDEDDVAVRRLLGLEAS